MLLIAFIVNSLWAASPNLKVVVSNIQIGKGNVVIDVYNSRDFLSQTTCFKNCQTR